MTFGLLFFLPVCLIGSSLPALLAGFFVVSVLDFWTRARYVVTGVSDCTPAPQLYRVRRDCWQRSGRLFNVPMLERIATFTHVGRVECLLL